MALALHHPMVFSLLMGQVEQAAMEARILIRETMDTKGSSVRMGNLEIRVPPVMLAGMVLVTTE